MKCFLTFVAAASNAWVRLLEVTWSGAKGINLRFSIESGRNGPLLARWQVAAADVREFDANGGGLQMSGGRRANLVAAEVF